MTNTTAKDDSQSEVVEQLWDKLQDRVQFGGRRESRFTVGLFCGIHAKGCQITPKLPLPHVWCGCLKLETTFVTRTIIPMLESESEQTFPDRQITVSDVFRGYRSGQRRTKIVLGVRVHQASKPAGSHIVKLGIHDEVKPYERGWTDCFQGHNVVTTMFLAVTGKPLLGGGHAIIYENAYRLFNTDPEPSSGENSGVPSSPSKGTCPDSVRALRSTTRYSTTRYSASAISSSVSSWQYRNRDPLSVNCSLPLVLHLIRTLRMFAPEHKDHAGVVNRVFNDWTPTLTIRNAVCVLKHARTDRSEYINNGRDQRFVGAAIRNEYKSRFRARVNSTSPRRA